MYTKEGSVCLFFCRAVFLVRYSVFGSLRYYWNYHDMGRWTVEFCSILFHFNKKTFRNSSKIWTFWCPESLTWSRFFNADALIHSPMLCNSLVKHFWLFVWGLKLLSISGESKYFIMVVFLPIKKTKIYKEGWRPLNIILQKLNSCIPKVFK